jgi:hypothetical protein
MPLPVFNDTNVDDLINNISDEDLDTLVTDLENDFDTAITDRFDASSSQDSTLSSTPEFFKTVMTTAIRNFKTIRDNSATVSFSMSGLNVSGGGGGLQSADIKITVSHAPNCTWTVGIEITK